VGEKFKGGVLSKVPWDINDAWEMGLAMHGTLRAEKWMELKRRYSLAIHISNKRLLGGKLSDLLWNTWGPREF
jgi:hypothetical protein